MFVIATFSGAVAPGNPRQIPKMAEKGQMPMLNCS
jgi:hypothetical protein